MSNLAAAISDAVTNDDSSMLLKAVRSLPSRPETVDPQSDDDSGPIPGESFDDVTAAWCEGLLSDEIYEAAIEAASGKAVNE